MMRISIVKTLESPQIFMLVILNHSDIRPRRTLQVNELIVYVYASAEEVAIAASAQATKILQTAIAEKGQARAVFATGRSQKQCLHYLTDPNHTDLDWSKVTGFHLDEYLGVAAAHSASFRQYLKTHLTDKVGLERFWAIAGDGLLPLDVCQQYEKRLRDAPLDLSFLGIGNNGHLAFNDPDVADFTDLQWVKIVRLDEKNRQQQADSTAFESLDVVPHYAFTLTLSAIGAIAHNLCLAFGKGKAEIVHRVVTGPVSTDCPASVLRQIPHAVLLIDEAAASLIPKGLY